MKLSVIGMGNVGKVLGHRWAQKGHHVIFGVRDLKKAEAQVWLKETGGNVEICDVSGAIVQSEVIVLAVPWDQAREVIALGGHWEGKTVVDCMNPLKSDLSGLVIGIDTSAAEQIAQWAKGAKVVKAFNCVGSCVMADPCFHSEKALMPICGDDTHAKSVVRALAEDLDFDVIDSGPLTAARYLEQMAMYWIHLAFQQEIGYDFAFKLLRR